MKTMQQLLEKVEQFQNRSTGAGPKGKQNKERLCWECGKGDTSGGITSTKRRPNPQIKPATVESTAACNRAPRRNMGKSKVSQ